MWSCGKLWREISVESREVRKIQRQRGVLIVSVNRIKGTSEDEGKGKEGGEGKRGS